MSERQINQSSQPRRRWLAAAFALVLAGCGAAPTIAPWQAPATMAPIRAQSVPGRYLVEFKGAAAAQAFQARTNARVYKHLAALGIDVVEMPAQMDLSTVQNASEVAFAEPDYVFQLNPNAAAVMASKDREDPGYAKQYNLRLVDAPKAWRYTTGSSKVTIAVIDSGIDAKHPDLKGKIVKGYNVLNPKAAPTDDHGHGTHVAGIAAATGGNGKGIIGMAPASKVMPIKVANAQGATTTSQIAEGIAYAVLNGADVINLSIGGPSSSKALSKAVSVALQHNIPVIAAMGNDGSQRPSYPAAYEGVIAVGSSNQDDKVMNYSQKGQWISVVAPGENIWSTTPTYATTLTRTKATTMHYGRLSGTSMAAPLVSGIVALMKSDKPSMSVAEIKGRLEASAEGSRRFSITTGHGRVNAPRALGLL